jgi:hypothetical protein
VDDFEVSTGDPGVAAVVFYEIDDHLTFPLKRMGLVTLFNRIDVSTANTGLHQNIGRDILGTSL